MLNQLNRDVLHPVEICVVVATFNGYSKGYLSECLGSIFQQTYQPKEVILVDDGSTDGTLEYVNKYYPQVKTFSQNNRGPSAARNRGILEANCPWIALLDDDDIWKKIKLEEQVLQILSCSNPQKFIFASRCEHYFENEIHRNKKISPPFFYTSWPFCLLNNPLPVPSGVIFSRSAFFQVGGFDSRLRIGEDFDLWLRFLKTGMKILYSNNFIVQYRSHPLQATSMDKMDKTLYSATIISLKYTQEIDLSVGSLFGWIIVWKHFLLILKWKGLKKASEFFSKVHPKTYRKSLMAAICVMFLAFNHYLPFPRFLNVKMEATILKIFLMINTKFSIPSRKRRLV